MISYITEMHKLRQEISTKSLKDMSYAPRGQSQAKKMYGNDIQSATQ